MATNVAGVDGLWDVHVVNHTKDGRVACTHGGAAWMAGLKGRMSALKG